MTPEERARRIVASKNCDPDLFASIAAAEIREAENQRTRECAYTVIEGIFIRGLCSCGKRLRERWPEAFKEQAP